MLSWDVLLESLLESEFALKNGDDEEGPMSAHLVSKLLFATLVCVDIVIVYVRFAL